MNGDGTPRRRVERVVGPEQTDRVAPAPAIEVRGLVKRFRDVTAVDDVAFTVPAGGVFAFLGVNGAGKTTTIACLTTTLGFDAGSVTVVGADVATEGDAVRRAIGVVFQESVLDPELTVRENLLVRARPYLGSTAAIRARIDELVALVELGEFVDRRYGRLSGGQRRRVDIARALVHDPRILFLDEPTTGLDPASRALVWATMHDLRARTGLTVFLTTHYMEETEEADEVCIIDRGRVIASGTPAELRARHSSSVLTLTTAAGVEELRVPDATAARRILVERGETVLDFEFRHGRMDDVFLALTGREPEGDR